MSTTDVPLSPDERFREVAAILAAGLLRLRTPACAALMIGAAGRRPQLAATAEMPGPPACPVASAGRHAAPTESSESAQKALGFPAPPRTDPHAGC